MIKMNCAPRMEVKEQNHQRPTAYLMVPNNYALLHITHWKAGAQWFLAILNQLFGAAVVPPDGSELRLLNHGKVQGRVFACVYLSEPEMRGVELPCESRRLVIVRDLRDTLASGYLSLRNSQNISNSFVAKWHHVLNSLNVEEGLIYVMEHWLPYSAVIQKSWIDAGVVVVKFEDLISGPLPIGQLFLKHWGLIIPDETINPIVSKFSFNQPGGERDPGEKDVQNHYGKGVQGEWRNYFTKKVQSKFKETFGETLIQAGYEKNLQW